MIRYAENFVNLAAGGQYVVDASAVAVGYIASDGGANALTHHASYPSKQPAQIPAKIVNREPSIYLGASNGHMLDVRVKFRFYDTSAGTGDILQIAAKIDSGGLDYLNFGNDGANWYLWCPGDYIVPDGSWSVAGAPDTLEHTLRIVLTHNEVYVWFDNETVGNFSYTATYATAVQFYANVILRSTSTWSVYWKWYDVILSQVSLIAEADDLVRIDGVGYPGAVVRFFDQSVHTPEYELTAGQNGEIDIASVTTPGTYWWMMLDPDLGYSGAGEYVVAGP